MPNYVDGFVLPVPKDKIAEYQAIAEKAQAIWKEHGALDYRETVLEDPDAKDMVSFPALAGVQEGETVVLAFIVYESREHRDAVNAKVMADPRIQEMCPDPTQMPFDCKRMAYGGFKTIVGD
ncbi:Uncharacterized conserved protein YbaA, DUF1428 family [Prosthecobacter debontii]|uniref:Uncharacterized conserved protein YbaA, DUF1428 family n=1 Tax=Prosthecobacter debontii TaxID=48467 RepID=A0A1T4Z2I8_9BACT|nr:DUF1428 domain-containing protein [Prosthecobacter debontii]SKB07755.1 Uncharacterized conserved protein YbaA, DUF1428 family [Prosthecobacter debontii]